MGKYRNKFRATLIILAVLVILNCASSAAAQEAQRDLPEQCVNGSSIFQINITASNYGAFGKVEETLCLGWTYVSSSLESSKVRLPEDPSIDNTITFILLGDTSFSYTVMAPSSGCCQITGNITDLFFNKNNITGESEVCVCTPMNPNISLSVNSVDFGQVEIGSFSSQNITVSNTGESALDISSISVSDPDFSYQGCAGSSISPGNSCDIQISFQPDTVGSRTAVMNITSNDLDTPHYLVGLSGEGVDTTPPTDIQNLQSTTDTSWIMWTWDDPSTDFNHTEVWIDGAFVTTTTSGLYNLTGLFPHSTKEIGVRSVDDHGNKGNFVNQSTTIPNHPVQITNTSDWVGVEGESVYLDFDFTDPDKDTGTFSTNATKGTLDTATGIFTWDSGEGDQGTYIWEFSVSDGFGSTSSYTATITVSDSTPALPENLQSTTGNFFVTYSWNPGANTDSFNINFNGVWTNQSVQNSMNVTLTPHGWGNITVCGYNDTLEMAGPCVSDEVQISNNPPELLPISDISVNEGATVSVDIDANDLDMDSLSYSCNRTDLFADFDSVTGQGTWDTISGDAGVYSVEFGVSDGFGGSDSQTVQIIVLEVFTPTPPTDIQYTIGNFWINWTWVKGNNSDFTVVEIDGIFQENSADNYFNFTAIPHGIYTIQLREYNSTQDIYSTYANQTVSIPNNPPELLPISDISVNEGATVSVDIDANDLDMDSLSYSCNRTDLFADFDSVTGQGTWDTISGDAGVYSVEFGVSDGFGGSDSQTVQIIVNDITPPASITGLMNMTFETSYVLWTWTDPIDVDFDHVTVFLDGMHVADIPAGVESYNASGLSPDTEYTISTQTVDDKGNANQSWVNHSARTAPIAVEKLPPVADFTFSPANPIVNQSIEFNASQSYDTDGNITNYHWDFGDGESSSGSNALPVINHSYKDTGSFIVNLTVTDNDGLTAYITKVVNVSSEGPPELPMLIYGYAFDKYTSEPLDNGTVTVKTDNGITVESEIGNGWYGEPFYNRMMIPKCNKFDIFLTIDDKERFMGTFQWSSGAVKRIDLPFYTGERINLKKGWNFISTSCMPVNTSVEYLMNGIDFEMIYYYNACERSWDIVDIIEPLKGYWVNVPYEQSLTIECGSYSEQELELCEGWNAIGSPIDTPMDAGTILSEVDSSYKQVWKWSADEQRFDLYGYNCDFYSTCPPTGVLSDDHITADNFTMEPNMGYWINVEVNGNNTISTIKTAEERCTDSGGYVTLTSCCEGVEDFPDLCVIGACGCSESSSIPIKTCNCGKGMCFNGYQCVAVE